MATISATVLDDGVPVPGAKVYVGEVGTALTTNANGVVTRTVPSDFAILAHIAVLVDGILRGSFGPILLEAGGSYNLDINATAPIE